MSLRRRTASLVDSAPWTVRILCFTLAASIVVFASIGVLFAVFLLSELFFSSDRLRSLFAIAVFVVAVLGATQALVAASA